MAASGGISWLIMAGPAMAANGPADSRTSRSTSSRSSQPRPRSARAVIRPPLENAARDAQAAPSRPSAGTGPRPKIKIGSSTRFTRLVTIIMVPGKRVLPWARNRL